MGTGPTRGGYSRPVYSDAEVTLREWFVDYAGHRGLDVDTDRNEILDVMAQLDVKEIHGYESDRGFQVFTEAVLARLDEHRTRSDTKRTPNSNGDLASPDPDPVATIPDPAPVAVPAPADDTASA